MPTRFFVSVLSVMNILTACKSRTTSDLHDVSAASTFYWSEGEYYFRGECPEGLAPSRSCKNNLSSLSKNEIASVQKRLGQVEEKELLKTLGLESIVSEADKLQDEYRSKVKLLAEIADPNISRELVSEEEKEFVDKLFRGRAALLDLKSLAAGNKRTCVIDSRGQLLCSGKVQDSSFTDIEVLGGSLTKMDAKSVYLGVRYMCIYRLLGELECTPTSNSHTKMAMHNIHVILSIGGSDIQSFLDSKNLICFTNHNTLYCSGRFMVDEVDSNDRDKKASLSTRRDYLAEEKLLVTDLGLSSLSVGAYHFCVVNFASLKCGGGNQSGQLGTGGTFSLPIEQELKSSVLENVRQAAAGYEHTCAVQNDGTLRCWGNNGNGQLGQEGTLVKASDMKSIVMKDVKKVVAGGNNTCAILDNGDLHCWGETPSKFVSGFVAQENTPIPQGVSETFIHKDVLDVAVSSTHICTLIANQGVKCWGDNSQGQLGFEGENYGDQPGETLDKLPAVFKYEGTPK